MGHKNSKGTISILKHKERIRLRWRYQLERYSLNLGAYIKVNLTHARKIAVMIEQDILNNQFDFSLLKYKGEPEKAKLLDKSIVSYFEEWVSDYKQMDCEKHTNYNSIRNMMKKWGKIEECNIQKKLSGETNAPVTYNKRITILKSFAKMIKLSILLISNDNTIEVNLNN